MKKKYFYNLVYAKNFGSYYREVKNNNKTIYKVKRKNYGHGGGAMVVTISKVKDKDKKNYKKK